MSKEWPSISLAEPLTAASPRARARPGSTASRLAKPRVGLAAAWTKPRVGSHEQLPHLGEAAGPRAPRLRDGFEHLEPVILSIDHARPGQARRGGCWEQSGIQKATTSRSRPNLRAMHSV